MFYIFINLRQSYAEEVLMAKFDIPKRPTIKRKYDEGERQLFTIRLPKRLLERLDREIAKKGYSKTELVEIIIDQYLQYSDEQ